MRAVSRFEFNLLRVLHVVLHQAPLERTLPLLVRPSPRPRCLSQDAVALVQDTLAKGCVCFLARCGWARERFLRASQIADGRLWQRTAPADLGLVFSRHALEFLMQLASGTLGSVVPKPSELTIGDGLLFLLAFDALGNTEPAEEMRKKWLPLYQVGLCRLAFMKELAPDPRRARIDWVSWTTGQGSWILEALQGWLADRWTRLENAKESIDSVPRMRAIGANQQHVHGEYLDALASARRWDLARCYLETARRLLPEQTTARKWIRNLDVRKERIADRLAIYHEALAFIRQMERFQRWQQEALGVGYFDEGYQASQLWKADWERYHGEALCGRACAIVHEVEPM